MHWGESDRFKKYHSTATAQSVGQWRTRIVWDHAVDGDRISPIREQAAAPRRCTAWGHEACLLEPWYRPREIECGGGRSRGGPASQGSGRPRSTSIAATRGPTPAGQHSDAGSCNMRKRASAGPKAGGGYMRCGFARRCRTRLGLATARVRWWGCGTSWTLESCSRARADCRENERRARRERWRKGKEEPAGTHADPRARLARARTTGAPLPASTRAGHVMCDGAVSRSSWCYRTRGAGAKAAGHLSAGAGSDWGVCRQKKVDNETEAHGTRRMW